MKTKFSISGYAAIKKKDAPVVVRELKRIEREAGVITPTVIVQYAKPKSSPLHKYFEWSDTVAAEKYREWQARTIINSVQVTITGRSGDTTVRAFVNVSPCEDVGVNDEIVGRGYISVQKVARNTGYKSQVVRYAYNQLVSWKSKFGNFKEFFSVARAIDDIKIG